MASFLVNPAMDPALRARIEMSLRGETRGRVQNRARPFGRALLRFGVVLAIGAGLALVLRARAEAARELEEEKRNFVQEIERARAALPPSAARVLPRVRTALVAATDSWSGDVTETVLVDTDRKLDTLLGRPLVYVRGALADFVGDDLLPESANQSKKDALFHCLVAPPRDESEKALLERAGVAYRGGTPLDEKSPNAHRLAEIFVVNAFLEPGFRKDVERAETIRAVRGLRGTWDRARIPTARRVLEAELFVYALDEPKKPGAPSEFDGASDHFVRFGIVELGSGRAVLLRRIHLDPSWISERNRHHFASGIDSCRAALRLRRELTSGASPKTTDVGPGQK